MSGAIVTAGGPKQPFRRLKDLRPVATRYTKLALGIAVRKLDQALRRGCPESPKIDRTVGKAVPRNGASRGQICSPRRLGCGLLGLARGAIANEQGLHLRAHEAAEGVLGRTQRGEEARKIEGRLSGSQTCPCTRPARQSATVIAFCLNCDAADGRLAGHDDCVTLLPIMLAI